MILTPFVCHGVLQDFIDYAALLEYQAAVTEYNKCLDEGEIDNTLVDDDLSNQESQKKIVYLSDYKRIC